MSAGSGVTVAVTVGATCRVLAAPVSGAYPGILPAQQSARTEQVRGAADAMPGGSG